MAAVREKIAVKRTVKCENNSGSNLLKNTVLNINEVESIYLKEDSVNFFVCNTKNKFKMEQKLTIAIQEADKWSNDAKRYTTFNERIHVVSYFSDLAAEVLSINRGKLSSGEKFLDVCAGPATYSIAVMKNIGLDRARLVNFTITDFSSGMVDAAKGAVDSLLPGHSNVEFRVTDAQNIDQPTNSFDVVGFMFGYFVPDRNKAFSEVYRVCKPGGKAVIGTWKHAGFAYIFADFLLFMGQTNPFPAQEFVHVCADGEKLKAELSALGFKEVVVHELIKVFDMPLEDDLALALFENPMIKEQVQQYPEEELLAHWNSFVRQPDCKYDVDLTENVLRVTHTANIVIATK